MAQITFKGDTINTIGTLPSTGAKAPDFVLTTGDLQDVSLSSYQGKKKILNIVPSLDTGVCATSARKFDKEIEKHKDTVCLTISADLPFAAARFCKTEGVTNVITLSQMRDKSFGRDYGCEIIDGPLAGLLSRAVVLVDENDMVQYVEQVPEIAQEPDYLAVLARL